MNLLLIILWIVTIAWTLIAIIATAESFGEWRSNYRIYQRQLRLNTQPGLYIARRDWRRAKSMLYGFALGTLLGLVATSRLIVYPPAPAELTAYNDTLAIIITLTFFFFWRAKHADRVGRNDAEKYRRGKHIAEQIKRGEDGFKEQW